MNIITIRSITCAIWFGIAATKVGTRFFFNQISSLPINIAVGFDGISAKLLRYACPVISEHLTVIINLSLSKGIFLSIWKKARQCTVHKKGNPT